MLHLNCANVYFVNILKIFGLFKWANFGIWKLYLIKLLEIDTKVKSIVGGYNYLVFQRLSNILKYIYWIKNLSQYVCFMIIILKISITFYLFKSQRGREREKDLPSTDLLSKLPQQLGWSWKPDADDSDPTTLAVTCHLSGYASSKNCN